VTGVKAACGEAARPETVLGYRGPITYSFRELASSSAIRLRAAGQAWRVGWTYLVDRVERRRGAGQDFDYAMPSSVRFRWAIGGRHVGGADRVRAGGALGW
jgi:hypothetical protein